MRSAVDLADVTPEHLVGTWRRFGPTGPIYEVIGTRPGDGDRVMHIRVVSTGEEIDYRLAELLDDPLAD